MHRLSPIILLLGLTINLFAQNPHGVDFTTDCSTCHTSEGWDIAPEFWEENDPSKQIISDNMRLETPFTTRGFDHSTTDFTLEGQHTIVDCRDCHQSLVFSEARTDCYSCHTDMHNQTVGFDCARCHNSENWLVADITQLHYDNGFPLLGAHYVANCYDCHLSETDLRFERIGNDCINCHLDEYNATTIPNHASAGFSTNCIECHSVNGFDWTTESINHSFFPLTGGHDIVNCAECHSTGDYGNTPTDCYACHQEDYIAAINPNHQSQGFPTDCMQCHTTDPDWTPASYASHDAEFFPIYSGEHNGEWNLCQDCHPNPSNYAEFTCLTCHTNSETTSDHEGIPGYSYNSTACLACHPMGEGEDAFNHNLTNFRLAGSHATTDCIECHSAGYAGTPMDCEACHTAEFNQATNPNHNTLGLSMDCASCHTEEPEWNPATFANHNEYHALNGAHAVIASDCAICHNGDYINTPTTCVGCHLESYNATTNPEHITLNFSTECESCHSENDWEPAVFDHNLTNFVLTGAHITTDCNSCHESGYTGTPTDCAACHTTDYNQSTNPNHNTMGLSMDCASCHTTEPEWNPATFANHNDYHALNGAHAVIANDCAVCHNGDYINTPNTCIGCHQSDYNNTTDPNHLAAQFPTDCESCHSENAWEPATFDHDGQYFPIYSGKHIEAWNTCADCHTNAGNYSVYACIDCHEHSNQADLADKHSDLPDYTYTSQGCFDCHPTGNAD